MPEQTHKQLTRYGTPRLLNGLQELRACFGFAASLRAENRHLWNVLRGVTSYKTILDEASAATGLLSIISSSILALTKTFVTTSRGFSGRYFISSLVVLMASKRAWTPGQWIRWRLSRTIDGPCERSKNNWVSY